MLANIHVPGCPIRIVPPGEIGGETAAQLHQVILAVKPDQVSAAFPKTIIIELLAVRPRMLSQTVGMNVLNLILERRDKLTCLNQTIIIVQRQGNISTAVFCPGRADFRLSSDHSNSNLLSTAIVSASISRYSTRLSAIELSEFGLEALAGFGPVLPRLTRLKPLFRLSCDVFRDWGNSLI